MATVIESSVVLVEQQSDAQEVSVELEKKLDINDSAEDATAADKAEGVNSKERKKLDKLIASILKKDGSGKGKFSSVDERYYALAEKFMEIHEQNKKLQLSSKETEKTFGKVSQQRDQMQAEYTKLLMVKEKLESLCRELQKQNKLVKVGVCCFLSEHLQIRKLIGLFFVFRKRVFKELKTKKRSARKLAINFR